jgi:hypothetical protein
MWPPATGYRLGQCFCPHTAALRDCLAAMNIKTIAQLAYSPAMVPVDYFLFPRGKAELAAISVTQETFHKTWDGVMRIIAKEDFIAAFRRWMERWEKCIRIGDDFIKK